MACHPMFVRGVSMSDRAGCEMTGARFCPPSGATALIAWFHGAWAPRNRIYRPSPRLAFPGRPEQVKAGVWCLRKCAHSRYAVLAGRRRWHLRAAAEGWLASALAPTAGSTRSISQTVSRTGASRNVSLTRAGAAARPRPARRQGCGIDRLSGTPDRRAGGAAVLATTGRRRARALAMPSFHGLDRMYCGAPAAA